MKSALSKIFKYITKDVEALFKGDHTRRIVKKIPKNNSGILRFVERKETCGCCGVVMSKSWMRSKNRQYKLVCESCQDDEIVQRKFESLSNKKKFYYKKTNECWKKCSTCKVRISTPDKCSNYDCSIFFVRTQYKNKYNDLVKKAEAFDVNDW